MYKHILKISLFVVVILSLFSCWKRKTPFSCEGAICTADFRMITVALYDSLGNDYVPDMVATYYNGNLLRMDSTAAIPGVNAYTIVTDSDMNWLGFNEPKDVTLKIYKGAALVDERMYNVKADCCHVQKVSGDDQIVIP